MVQPFFLPDRLPTPQGVDDEPFFGELEERLKTGEVLGMFVEPVLRRRMLRMSQDVLQRIVETCRRYATPIIFHETASLFYRYDSRAFTASGIPGIQPDASIVFLGGQMALVCMSKELFIDEPLMLISTWEGDALSLAQFHRGMQVVQRDPQALLSDGRRLSRQTDGRDAASTRKRPASSPMGLGGLPACRSHWPACFDRSPPIGILAAPPIPRCCGS